MKQTRFAVLLAASITLASAGALAATPATQTLSGKDLVTLCKATTEAAPGAAIRPATPEWQCRSYLQGYFEALHWINHASPLRSPMYPPGMRPAGCISLPDFVSFTDLAKVIVTFADAHPDALADTASGLTHGALEEKYPCPAPPAGQVP